jgi:hypothetical protein
MLVPETRYVYEAADRHAHSDLGTCMIAETGSIMCGVHVQNISSLLSTHLH